MTNRTAIIGLACRVPGAITRHELEALLRDGRSETGEVPRSRWSMDWHDPDPALSDRTHVRRGGFVGGPRGENGPDRFDATFFRVSPREAERMDPQHRFLLEVTWEALEDAGVTAASLAGTRTGVFVGLSTFDYARLPSPEPIDPISGYTCSLSIAANRISYWLDVRGPSLTVDTACSSGLVAVHLARQALLRGECDTAIVGAANALLHPDVFVMFGKAGMLAPDGLCKAFDARANGYVRSEGVVVLVLRREDLARTEGDRVLAWVAGSAVNQDGRSNGLTAPNPQAQIAVVREAWGAAGRDPREAACFECHGTGTALGDPIEVRALSEAVFGGQVPEWPIPIASVKTNLGHMEAAAGLVGLAKLVVAAGSEMIPPSLHFEHPNPRIDFPALGLRVADRLEAWPETRAFAGVSAFGYGGTNAHVVIERASAPEVGIDPRASDREWFSLSAHGEAALRERAETLAAWLGTHAPAPSDLAHTLKARRSHLQVRAAWSATDLEGTVQALTAIANGTASSLARVRVWQGRAPHRKPKIAWVMSGQGGAWPGMGRSLYTHEASFREAVLRVRTALLAIGGPDVVPLLCGELTPAELERPVHVQPAVFALQLGLAALWRQDGVQPSVVLGHSLGEIAAAYTAGVLDLEAAVRLVWARSRALAALAGTGSMLAVLATPAELAPLEDTGVAIAGVNGPRATVVAGSHEALERARRRLDDLALAWRDVAVDIPFHSPATRSVLPTFTELASSRAIHTTDAIAPSPRLPWISTVTGECLEPSAASVELSHWQRNITAPVQFVRACERAIALGVSVFLELGPHELHGRDVRAILEHAGKPGRVLASSRRGIDPRIAIAEARAELYVQGFDPVACPRGGRVLALPRYPWQHESHWLPPAPAPRVAVTHPLLGPPFHAADREATYFACTWQPRDLAWLGQHRVGDQAIAPGASLIELALAAVRGVDPRIHAIEDAVIGRPLRLPAEDWLDVQVVVQREAGRRFAIEVHARSNEAAADRSSWTRHLSARASSATNAVVVDEHGPVPPSFEGHAMHTIAASAWDEGMRARGFAFGPAFRRLGSITVVPGRLAVAPLDGTTLPGKAEAFLVHPSLLDAGFQLLVAAHAPEDDAAAYLPLAFGRVHCRGGVPTRATAEVTHADAHGLTGNVWYCDDAGTVCAFVGELQFACVPRSELELAELAPAWAVRHHPVEVEPTPAPTLAVEVRGDGTWARQIAAALPLATVPAAATHVVIAANDDDDLEAELGSLRLALDEANRLTGAAIRTRTLPRLVLVRPAHDRRFGSSTGLVATLSAETPELRPLAIAWDGRDARALARALAIPPRETAVRITGEGLTVPRLVRTRLPAQPGPTTGVLLVTGGLGALGQEIARAWIEHGGRALALLGRRAPDPATERRIAAWRAEGVQVVHHAVDVSDPVVVEPVIRSIERELGTITVVAHAAGVLDDALVADVDASRLARVVLPKLGGTRTLLAALAREGLRRVVLFGSIAAHLPSMGQSAYAAANAALEAEAEHFRALGFPVVCAAFGPWSDVGMAAEDPRRGARLAAMGLLGISPELGRRTFLHLLAGELPQPLVLAKLVLGPSGPDGEPSPFARLGEHAPAVLDGLISKEHRGRTPARPTGTRLVIGQKGDLDSLGLVGCERPVPGPGQVEIAIAAAGVNFRDVLGSLDMYPGDPGPLGGEGAGVVTAVGPGVTGFVEGDRVMAMFGHDGMLRSHAIVDADLAVPLPNDWTSIDGATAPVAWVTAWHGLVTLARVKPGERVLVHAGTGGVGVAAILLARHLGAVVIATAGSEEKRTWLRGFGVNEVLPSRDPAFGEALGTLEPIDVAFGAVPPAVQRASIDHLRHAGRYVDIGKADMLDDARKAELAARGLGYHVFDLVEVRRHAPERVASTLAELRALADDGTVRPLPHLAVPCERAVEAFRCMAASRHIGKLVVTWPDASTATSASTSRTASEAATNEVGVSLRALAPATRRETVARELAALVARATGHPAHVLDPHTPLQDFGIDSLQAVDLRVQVERKLGVALPPAVLLREPTLARITAAIDESFGDGEATPTTRERLISGRWLAPLRIHPAPRARILVAPYAGGSAGAFATWSEGLPDCELLAIQLPGREDRHDEPFARDLATVLDAVIAALVAWTCEHPPAPLVVFGHSFGGLVAFELARRLPAHGLTLAAVILSAIRSPRAIAGRGLLHGPTEGQGLRLDGDDFVTRAQRLGGIPTALLSDGATMELLTERIRADLALVERADWTTDARLDCPVHVLAGTEDPLAPREDVEAWRAHAATTFDLHTFEGGHFFIESRRSDVLSTLAEILSPRRQPLETHHAIRHS